MMYKRLATYGQSNAGKSLCLQRIEQQINFAILVNAGLKVDRTR